MHAVWVRTEKPFISEALSSVCVICSQQVDEPLAALTALTQSLRDAQFGFMWANMVMLAHVVLSVSQLTQMLTCTEQKVTGMG